ncbi:UDP-glucuronosyl and UDP-glucosyl transferase [Handroanthus impetiginosus]|uniref:UDP-glucuronosyl and UDP-glucosyl transferase n=1 Tax=Handroanthus impetiginosus TaxID=429701 RepID=A0A2G9I225_9LAMI|nr:UDP-glucuronosyl and UDP-glucosyl transferase [Handroanthus impetiginosus]
MAFSSENPKKPHAVFVPFPTQGRINPLLKLAKLLHYRGFHITFVNAEFNHNRLVKSKGSNVLQNLPHFCFETIPDGLPPSDINATQDLAALCESTRKNCLVPFGNLVKKLNDSPGSLVPPVSCVIADGAMSFTLQVSQELNIPNVLFWTFGACGFLGFKLQVDLISSEVTPFKDTFLTNITVTRSMSNFVLVLKTKGQKCQLIYISNSNSNYLTNGTLDTPVDWLPGLKNFQLKHIPAFIRTTDPNDLMLDFIKGELKATLKASAIILHTVDALEHETLDILSPMFPPIYTIGPLQLLVDQIADKNLESTDYSLWKEEVGINEWLNSKEQNSVLSVNFGSIAVLTGKNILELAMGLKESDKNFLWVIRPDMVKGKSAILPLDFVDETNDRGPIVGWCPQDKILNHPSDEQPTNCRFVCAEWGIGLEIGDLKRGEIGRVVRELMDGEEGKKMKKRALGCKEKATEAARGPYV